MLPFHIVSEISRTLALAVRLFGNIMSGSMIVAILLAIAPLFFPVLMQVLGLLIGLIQAYIFAILAMVYIAAAIRRQEETPQEQKYERRANLWIVPRGSESPPSPLPPFAWASARSGPALGEARALRPGT